MAGVLIFILLVSYLFVSYLLISYRLGRRILLPLGRLSDSIRAIGDGARGGRVQVEGEGKVAEVARAFNEVAEALESRSDELEKAVRDLRTSNADLRRARDELHRTERLAAVGSLAAGVAHEVGNPMAALLAFLELARRDPAISQEAEDHLQRATEQGGRVREILRQLLDFSRPRSADRVPVDLTTVVDRTIGLVDTQKRYSGVEIERVVDQSGDLLPLPLAVADEGMAAQILLNLVLNACDAALEAEHPRVEIRLGGGPLRVRAGEDRDAATRERSAYDAIECVVSDNGRGVAETDRERIFDPYFTTKDPGQGTGLGLATSLRLALELSGELELLDASRLSGLSGASFVLRLPVQREGSESSGVRDSQGVGAGRSRSNRPGR